MVDAFLNVALDSDVSLIIGVLGVFFVWLAVMLPWRRWLFAVSHVLTRRYMRWVHGRCIERSYGMRRPCVLWKGHAAPHRARHEARWKQANRR